MENDKQYRILVIENELALRETIRDVLELNEFQVITAENGSVGIQKAVHEKPDVILCDIMMPVMDGYDVIREIRNNPDLDLVPFIFLTAKPTQRDHRLGMNMGADDYLIKPFHNEMLIKVVNIRLKKIERLKKAFVRHYQTIDRFLDLNSHEIRGPLCNILALASFLEKKPEFRDVEYVDLLLKSARKLDNVIKEANEILVEGAQFSRSATYYRSEQKDQEDRNKGQE
ncbi:MAG: response regulator [Bacteroidota bacterium]